MAGISKKRFLELLVAGILFSGAALIVLLPPQLDGPRAQLVKTRLQHAQDGDAGSQFSLGLDYHLARGIPRDYGQAMRWYQAAAEQGHAGAQANLGNMYFNGEGVPKDNEKARFWYEKAAAQNEKNAVHNLGTYYLEAHQYEEAVKWFKKSMELGSPNGILDLGLMYNRGQGGLPKDPVKAMELYQQAAAAGIPVANNNIGAMYHNGEGVPVDYQKAMEWYMKAANTGLPLAQRNVGRLYFYGKGVPIDFVKAREWYQKAADQHDETSIAMIGYMNYAGIAGPANFSEAIAQYEKAAKLGDVEAMQTLAWFYKEGKGTLQNDQLANEWYSKAFQEALRKYEFNKTDDDIILTVANAYYFGRGVEENQKEGMRYYQEAAARNNGEAEYMIGRAYFNGEAGYEMDYSKGMEWFKKAAEHNNYSAYRHLAYAYCAGKGVDSDRKQSRYWLERSAERGDPIAKQMLERHTEAEFLSILLDTITSASPVFTLLRSQE